MHLPHALRPRWVKRPADDLLTLELVYLLTLKVVSESRVMWATSANFSLPRPLCSRFRSDVRDKQTSDRQTPDVREHHHLMPPPFRGGGIIISYQCIICTYTEHLGHNSWYWHVHCTRRCYCYCVDIDLNTNQFVCKQLKISWKASQNYWQNQYTGCPLFFDIDFPWLFNDFFMT